MEYNTFETSIINFTFAAYRIFKSLIHISSTQFDCFNNNIHLLTETQVSRVFETPTDIIQH